MIFDKTQIYNPNTDYKAELTEKQALDTVDFKIFKPKSICYDLDSDKDD